MIVIHPSELLPPAIAPPNYHPLVLWNRPGEQRAGKRAEMGQMAGGTARYYYGVQTSITTVR